MADNVALKDALGAQIIARAKDLGGGIFALMSLPMDANGNPNDITHPIFHQITAGEAHVGELGGRNVEVTALLAVTAASAYASGNNVGGKLTLANFARIAGGSGLIQANFGKAWVSRWSHSAPGSSLLYSTLPPGCRIS